MSALKEIDALIRSGQARVARERLQKLVTQKLRRADLSTLANLAWRSNLPNLAIQLLNSVVRPTTRPGEPATTVEKMEYAVSLIKIGAVDEGLSLLDTLDLKAFTQAALYRAFAHINRWEYRQAIPLLEAYLKQISDPYSRIVGEINLTQSLLFERKLDEAQVLIAKLLPETERPEYSLARGTLFEFQAVRLILLGEWEQAEPVLSSAEATLSQTGGIPSFLVTKWKTILQFLKSNGREPGARQALSELRVQALRLSSWETVRECDRYQSKTDLDVALHLRLYFGTPFRSYRAQIAHDFPSVIDLPAHYGWQLGHGPTHTEIDLSTGDISTKKGTVKVEKLLLRTLAVLSSDFYRPFRIASLHHALHPGEFFNPVSSPARVHRAVQRLRKYFEAHHISLEVVHRDGFYQLEPSGGATVLHVPQAAPVLEGVSPELFLLKREYKEKPFSLKEAAELLKTSSRTAHRIVQRAEDTGDLLRLGRGKLTRYHFFKKAA